MQKTVEIAIKGGWETPYEYGTLEATENYIYFYPRTGQGRIDYPISFALIDPLFWQGIVRGLGILEKEKPALWKKWNERIRELATKDRALELNRRMVGYLHTAEEHANLEGFFNNLINS